MVNGHRIKVISSYKKLTSSSYSYFRFKVSNNYTERRDGDHFIFYIAPYNVFYIIPQHSVKSGNISYIREDKINNRFGKFGKYYEKWELLKKL